MLNNKKIMDIINSKIEEATNNNINNDMLSFKDAMKICKMAEETKEETKEYIIYLTEKQHHIFRYIVLGIPYKYIYVHEEEKFKLFIKEDMLVIMLEKLEAKFNFMLFKKLNIAKAEEIKNVLNEVYSQILFN